MLIRNLEKHTLTYYSYLLVKYLLFSKQIMLVADKTNNLIGISETLVSTAVAGILFALLSGQPLVIIGTTGPLLLFDESLYKVREIFPNSISVLTGLINILYFTIITTIKFKSTAYK